MRPHLLLGAAFVAACSGTSSTPATAPPAPSANCARAPRAAAAGGGPPVAILHDLAAAEGEYLMGVPGKSYVRIREPNLFTAPILAGGGLFFSERNGTKYETRFARYGECSTLVSPGYLGPVDPHGRAALVYDASGNHARIVSTAGRVLATLSRNAGNWTNDGQLVLREPSAIAVYDLSGKRRVLPSDQRTTPTGLLGPRGEIVTTSAGDAVMDLQTGRLTPIPGATQQLAGSPDGRNVVVMDFIRGWQLKRLSDGRTTDLATVGPPVATSWSPDGAWLSIETLFGGEVMHVADGAVTDVGPLLATF